VNPKYFLWFRRGLVYRGTVSCLVGRVRCQLKNLAGEEAESIKILWHLPDRIHLAPSSWATFEAEGFTVLSFVPQVAVKERKRAEGWGEGAASERRISLPLLGG
jgi:hypothetical protein